MRDLLWKRTNTEVLAIDALGPLLHCMMGFSFAIYFHMIGYSELEQQFTCGLMMQSASTVSILSVQSQPQRFGCEFILRAVFYCS